MRRKTLEGYGRRHHPSSCHLILVLIAESEELEAGLVAKILFVTRPDAKNLASPTRISSPAISDITHWRRSLSTPHNDAKV